MNIFQIWIIRLHLFHGWKFIEFVHHSYRRFIEMWYCYERNHWAINQRNRKNQNTNEQYRAAVVRGKWENCRAHWKREYRVKMAMALSTARLHFTFIFHSQQYEVEKKMILYSYWQFQHQHLKEENENLKVENSNLTKVAKLMTRSMQESMDTNKKWAQPSTNLEKCMDGNALCALVYTTQFIYTLVASTS